MPIAWSYTRALTAPGTDSIAARSTEWLRDHGLGGIVNRVEEWWYTHHPPMVGGVPKGGIPRVPSATRVVARGTVPVRPVPATVPVPGLPRPPDVTTPAATPLAGEGVWSPTGLL